MQRRSLFYKYLISYLLLGSIPVAMLGAILYVKSVGQFQKEITQFHLSKLNQAQLNIDSSFSKLQQLALQMSTDSKLSPFLIHEGYRPIETTALIKKYKEGNPLISEIFLYYRDFDMLYTSSGSFSSDSFQQYMYNDFGWDKISFIHQLNSADSLSIDSSTLGGPFDPFSQGNTLAMFVPIPMYSSTPTGVVVFAIKASMLSEIVQNIVGNSNSDSFILDADGKFLAVDNRSIHISQEQLTELIKTNQVPDIYDFEYIDTPYSYLVAQSEKTKWSLITIVPKNQLFRSVHNMQAFMIAILSIIAFAAVITALYLTRRNYAPVRKLLFNLSSMARTSGEQVDHRQGEWEMIQSAVNHTLAANVHLTSKLHEQNSLIKELRFTRLLEGTPLEEQEIEELHQQVGWTGHKFAVAYVHFRGRCDLDARAMKVLAAMNQVLTFEGGYGCGVELHHEDAVAFIVSLDNGLDSKRRLAQKLFELNELVRESFAVRPVAGIGGIVGRIQEIHRSFIEAKGVIQYFPHHDGTRAIFFDEVFTHAQEQFWYPLEEQVRLSQSLLHGDALLAEESIRNLFSKISQKDHSLEMVRCIYYDILNMVIKAVNQLQADSFQDDIRKLLLFQSAEQLESQLLAFCRKLCDYVLEAKTKKNESLISQIVSFVMDHFRNADLSLESVSDYFGMTSSYLSKLFKQETNVTFSEYLKQLRLNEFKLGLKETDKSIKDLVAEVGYWDIPSFSRTFKQLEGMTPGEYRKKHKQQTDLDTGII